MKQLFLFAFVLSVLFQWGCTKGPVTNPDDQTTSDYELIWSDEFDYIGLPDKNKWSYDIGGSGWGNSEAQYYTDSRLKNSEVKDGYLYINAIKEDFGGKKYTSARLVTRTKGDWLYGKIEVNAKLPDGIGMWPAIWMLPTDWAYGGWPESGEIDIMENLGYIPYFIAATVQTKSYNFIQNTHKNAIIAIPDSYTKFHNYIMEWETGEIRIYVDSKLYLTFKNERAGFHVWPFDKRFHLLLNVAVGGTFGGAQGIDDSIFPRSMVIDYVRIYQKK
ncbi:MAG: glycoside hydrolase [Odoribacter sp.]|nr:glycoside hydrolase [Odoribacter sp.]